jgi:hypothetical protein
MFDVPRCVDEHREQSPGARDQHGRAGSVDTAGHDLLFDLYPVEAS